MGIFDFIATVDFNKEGFYDLIDVDERLDAETKQFYWDEFAVYCKKNLIVFYQSLDEGNPVPQYVKQSMNHFFYRKALDILQGRDGQ